MTRANMPAEQSGSAAPGYRLDPWSPAGTAVLTATGNDAGVLLLAGLQGVLAATGGDRPTTSSDEAATAAAPIRGQGPDLSRVFAELAADLLAQLDANGPGLDHVRLDGLLQTDDGGFTAWGYAVGATTANPPPVGISLDGDPSVTESEGGLTLRCTLRRG